MRRTTISWQVNVALIVLLSGCADINGGAVELHWELRCNSELCCPTSITDGDIAAGNTDVCKELAQRMTCEEAGIQSIEFNLDCADSTCQVNYVFPCEDLRGQTEFEISEAKYEITILPIQIAMQPVSAGVSTPAYNYVVPPAIERKITDGNLSDLGVLAVLVEDI